MGKRRHQVIAILSHTRIARGEKKYQSRFALSGSSLSKRKVSSRSTALDSSESVTISRTSRDRMSPTGSHLPGAGRGGKGRGGQRSALLHKEFRMSPTHHPLSHHHRPR